MLPWRYADVTIPLTMTKHKTYLFITLFLLLLSLAAVVYLSTFTRLHADDFCIAADIQQTDFFSFFAKWYSSWTGRFSYIILAGLLGLGGADLASLLPLVSLVIWLAALTWALVPPAKRFGVPIPLLTAANAATFLLLILFSVTPNLFQSFFWKDGLINYSFPLVGFTLLAGLFTHLWEGSISLPVAAPAALAVSFFSGGFSEVFSSMQVAGYFVFILFLWRGMEFKNKKPLLTSALLVFTAAVAAFMVVLFAPGNAVRGGLLAAHPGMLRLVTFSLRNAVYIIAKFFIFTPGWALLSLLISMLAGWGLAGAQLAIVAQKVKLWRQPWFRGVVFSSFLTFVFVLTACVPVVYMLNAYPDDRTIFLPLFFVVVGFMLASGLLTFGLRRSGWLNISPKNRKVRLGALVLLSLCLVAAFGMTVWGTAQKAPEYRQYATNWDQRDQQIRQEATAGKTEITAYGLPSRFGLADLRVEDDYWVNRCMADYYHMEKLIGK